ncbi:hypothetical protein ACSMDY_01810 [Raoultella ornithinolytica]|uniref:hypothetical protein n=1 Tax=Raoultella ornithinolytica TaxID=54291 RepID=UPI003F1C4C68
MKTPSPAEAADIRSLFDAVNQRNTALVTEFDNLQATYPRIYESETVGQILNVYAGKVKTLDINNVPVYVNQLNEINTVLETLIRYSGAWIGIRVAA